MEETVSREKPTRATRQSVRCEPVPRLFQESGSRSPAGEDASRLVEGGSAEDGGQDADVRDPPRFRLQRVLLQDDEVGELAWLERADLVLPVAGVGRLGGVQGERVTCGQALGRAEYAAVARAAQDGVADADAGIGGDDGRVGGSRDRDAGPLPGGEGVQLVAVITERRGEPVAQA